MKKHNNLNGLNGAFSNWLKGAIRWAIGAVADTANASTGSIFRGYVSKMAAKLESYFDGGSDDLFRPSQSLSEPTPQEQVFLDAFVMKISAFVKILLFSLDQGFASSQANKVIVNAVLSKICITKEYFFYNEKEGLSQNAINLRHKLIQELLSPIEESITERLGVINGLPIKVVANQNDFNALFKNSVANQQYLCKQYSVSGNNNALPGNNNTLPGNNNALPGNNNTLPGNNNALPGNNNTLPGTNNTTVTDPENKEKSIFTFQNLVLSVSLIATIIGLSKSKK